MKIQPRADTWIWLQYGNLGDLAFLIAARVRGLRVIVTPHLGVNWRSQSNPVLRRISSTLLQLAQGIAYLSDSQLEELPLPTTVPRVRIRTFLPGHLGTVTRDRFSDLQVGALKLVHAGRLSGGKGTFLFLDICVELQRAGMQFEARLIGSCDSPTRQQLLSVIKANSLQGCVHLVGPVSEQNLLMHLSSSDVLIHLSSVDSFPLIVLESIGVGLFPVCLDLPGARQIVREYCGYLVNSNSPVESVAQFLLNTDLAALRSAGRKASTHVVADFGWPACVKSFEDALSSISKPELPELD